MLTNCQTQKTTHYKTINAENLYDNVQCEPNPCKHRCPSVLRVCPAGDAQLSVCGGCGNKHVTVHVRDEHVSVCVGSSRPQQMADFSRMNTMLLRLVSHQQVRRATATLSHSLKRKLELKRNIKRTISCL